MFKKKQCKKCNRKISSNYDFCPHCGALFNQNYIQEDFGMLGKNDFSSIEEMNNIRLPMGFNLLFNSLMKNLNKELKNLDSEMKREAIKKDSFKQTQGKGIKKGGISISISTSGDKPPEIRVNSFGNLPEFKEKEREIKGKVKKISPKLSSLSKSDMKKYSKLEKENPETNIRRLSNKVVYEINLPGVESLDNVSINQLENSIEIKALSTDKAFLKLIPINLPIINYNLLKGKLILELQGE